MTKKFKGKLIKLIGILSCTAMLTSCALSPENFLNYDLEDGDIVYIDDLKLTVDYVAEGNIGRPGVKREIQWIVIHDTGNPDPSADAEAHNDYLHEATVDTKVSWHYTVDDTEIYAHIPDSENAFHAGDGWTENGGNMAGIGIEMCINEGSDYEQTLENGAKLAAYLLHKYSLTIDDVKTHRDFSGKICPKTLYESGRLDEFYGMIYDEYMAMSEEEYVEGMEVSLSKATN